MKPLPGEMHLPDKVLGILQTENSVAARARDRAYRTFLEARGVPNGATFDELPVTDKASPRSRQPKLSRQGHRPLTCRLARYGLERLTS
jgi:hypothetical protein